MPATAWENFSRAKKTLRTTAMGEHGHSLNRVQTHAKKGSGRFSSGENGPNLCSEKDPARDNY